jgi:hypothetical protein
VRRLLVAFAAVSALWFAPNALASGWCGNAQSAVDRPDIVAGAQIHAIVALPADAPDTFAADAARIADDVGSIDAWWTGQDPTRVPRFDLAAFPAGTCLDLSFVRLPNPAAAYSVTTTTAANATFDAVVSQLAALGFSDFYKKYLVYVDGFGAVTDSICGTGAGEFAQGGDFAAVWLRACGVPTDAVGAHELLHALGALPAGAPHACTPATDPFGNLDLGHPCDSPTDILYPATSGVPLTQLVLDYGHDDYYAHSGTWVDIQDSLWLRHLNAPQEALALAISGHGSVFSDLPGVVCATSCTTQWDQGTRVTLTAVPDDRQRFVRWSGACTVGEPDQCVVSLAAASSVMAVFGPARVAMHLSHTGRGTIRCAPLCAPTAEAGSPLVLTAVAAKGWKFVRWSGTCKGTSKTCRLTPAAAFSAHATFAKIPVRKKKR